MWNTDLKHWKKVNKEVYKFCLEQGEKRLKDIIDDSEKITSRSYTLIGVLIPVLSICVGIVLKYVIDKTTFDLVVYLSIICVPILGCCLWHLSKLVGIRRIWHAGTEPKNLCKSEFIEFDSFKEEDAIKYLQLSEIEQIQYKIDENKNVNYERMRVFNNCLTTAITATIIILTSILCLAII
jgi:hypothetical protein